MAQTQRREEWRRHLPIGVLLEMGAQTSLPSRDGGTTATDANNSAGMVQHINNTLVGFQQSGLRYVLIYKGSPYFHEVQQGLLAALEANTRGGYLWAMFQPMTRRTSTAGTGLTEEFVGVGVANTRAVADPLVQTVVDDLSDHPCLLAYVTSDDTDSTVDATAAAKNNTLVQSFQALDPHGRPASAMWRNRGYADLGADCQFIITYEYPCGKDSGGTDTAEGDFHRSTFGTITGTSNPDWVDVIRHRVALLPTGARHMWCLQAHFTNSGAASSRLRQPTDREMRKIVWVALGEGATGLFWFTYTDFTVSTPQPMIGSRQSSNAVASEMATRITPKMRKLLLGCTKSTDLFTTSGGGTSGLPVNYTSAYVSTLTHADGTRYVVICNNDTSSASVTVSSATLTGYLVSMENGTRYKIGTDSISLPPLDGTILEYDPAYGVPSYPVDFSKTVKTWWDGHWANPASASYVASANIKFWPNEINVPLGADLQTYVNAYPDKTTFVLPAGFVQNEILLLERNSLHFRAADPLTPANRPIIRNVRIFGTEHAQQYNSDGTDYGYVAKLYSNTSDSSLTTGGNQSIRALAQKAFLREPTTDIIFDGIRFVANPSQSVVYYQKFTIGSTYQTDHWYEGSPIGMRAVRRILIQRCTTENYVWGSDNSSVPPNNPQQNSTGPVSHPGLFWGNAGIEQITVRDCTFTFATNAANTGSPSATFFDGCQGFVGHNNTLTGKQNQDSHNFLINDDYTVDLRQTGVLAKQDQRQSRYVVIAASSYTTSGSTTICSISGEQFLATGNTLDVGTGTIPSAFEFSTKICRLNTTRGLTYESYNFWVENNTFVCNTLTAAVEWNVRNGYTPGLTKTDPLRSVLGRATITGNTARRTNLAASTVTRWQIEDSASITDGATADGPMVLSGNNVNDGSGVGV